MTRVPRTAAPLGAAAGVALLWAGVAAADPRHNDVPLCPLLALTGLQCPFCGGLRAADALAAGDVAGAAGHNALVLAVAPLVAVWWLGWVRAAAGGRAVAAPSRSVVAVVVGAALVFGLLRNVAG